ncbi:transcription elongation factor/antiterminator RfaH [Chitinophaga skermanii]|uniref:Transcription elongation factor/antiterminator RfaH n=1 Tax=Chitinophaga skermanii TaxID=331697 RepID=A0A327R2V7_9BACT|nr:UpxY family transcription antiterminator [Chitinophaga skermanii]RAJ11156.1 transcription elongation factor/antiterminator RfaH [Chitinophaga skermanii]
MQPNNLCNWYVLYTRFKSERKVAKQLSDAGIETYVPLRTVRKQWSDRMKMMEEPLFWNYVFVKINLKERFKILATSGVVQFVSFENQPVEMAEKEIENIRIIESSATDVHLESIFIAGDKVLVTKGVFNGMEGILVKKSSKDRLVLKLPVLKQAISIEMPEAYVSKVS